MRGVLQPHTNELFVIVCFNRCVREAGLSEEKGFDVLPLLVLAGLVVLGLACWWLFPALIHVIKHQDCVGSGRMDC